MFSLEHLTATERHLVAYLEAQFRPGAQSVHHQVESRSQCLYGFHCPYDEEVRL